MGLQTVPGQRDRLVVTDMGSGASCLDLNIALALTNGVSESMFFYLAKLQFSHL